MKQQEVENLVRQVLSPVTWKRPLVIMRHMRDRHQKDIPDAQVHEALQTGLEEGWAERRVVKKPRPFGVSEGDTAEYRLNGGPLRRHVPTQALAAGAQLQYA